MIERPIAGDPTGIDWTAASGGFAPVCELCGYRGVERAVHADAAAAARTHAGGLKHRHLLRRRQVRAAQRR